MVLGQSSINYMLRFRGIYQRMKGVKMDEIIPLHAIVNLYHDRYPGVKIRYLLG